MPHWVPNSGTPPDPAPNSPQFSQTHSIAETQSSEPDRVVAYLRSVIRNPEPPPKPESRLFSFLSRKRRTEPGSGHRIAPAPQAPVTESAARAVLNPEPAAPAPAAALEAAPVPLREEDELQPKPLSPEPTATESVPAAEPVLETVASVSTSAEPESRELPEVESAPAPVPEEPAFPESAEEAVLEAAAIASAVPESILESLPEPIAEVASTPAEPVSEAPRPAVLRGEVLPPEAFPAGSAERRHAAEPARVITMQPGVHRAPGSTPPTRQA